MSRSDDGTINTKSHKEQRCNTFKDDCPQRIIDYFTGNKNRGHYCPKH